MTPPFQRINFGSKSPFEPLRGYSRAVQLNDQLFVSGTTAMSEGGDVFAPGDAYEQTRYVLGRIKHILEAASFAIKDVVRTRLFVTQINRWEEYARAHREVFDTIRPASSIVQVAKLVDARLMLEMEVDAVRGYEVAINRSTG